MRKFTLLLAVLMVTLIANTQVLLDESFTAGFPNPSAVGTTITANDWTTITGTTFSNAPSSGAYTKTTTTSLNYIDAGNAKSYINSGIGNSLYVNYTGVSSSTNTNYSSKSFSASPISTGILYLSFLYKCTANGGSGSQVIGISDQSASAGSAGAVVYCGYTSPNLKLGVVRGATSNSYVQWTTSTISLNTVYFVVLKYDMTVTPIKASLYINPTIGGTEPVSPSAFDDGTINAQAARTAGFQYLKQCTSGANKAYFNASGARVSQSWADAVAPYLSALPTLNTPTITGGAQTINNNGFTAIWSNGDANAAGYSVKTYIGTNIVPVNTTTAAAGATSVDVTGLMSGLDYTYKVTALGDNISYQNSAESSSSTFTTTGRVSSINTDFGDGTWGTVYNSTTVPATGTYPSSSANGFDLIKTVNYFVSNNTGPKGEVHTGYMKLDKLTYGGMLVLPTVTNIQQLEIHGYPASTPRDFYLKQYINGVWTAVGSGTSGTTGTYTMTSISDAVFIIPITSNNTNAKFRIENGGPGGINILQVITRQTNPLLLSTPTVGIASAITATTFTSNWTPVDPNATNYEVKVYKVITSATTGVKTETTTLKATAITSGGQTTTNIGVTGLQADSTYIYKVKAIGDGDVSFSDSYQTISSAQFTMAHQLATPDVSAGGSLRSASGFSANWATVANASSYNVVVYDGTATQVGAISNVAASNTSLAITGLNSDASYTYTVTAIGDQVSYFNSTASALSAAYITSMATPVTYPPTNVSLSGGSFTANWAAVNNASSYDVIIYDATSTQVGTTTNVAAGTLSLDVSGLNSNTSYTYTVTAKGDGVSHFNSVPSAPVYVSIYTGTNNLSGNSFITASGKTILSSETGLIQVYNLQGSKMIEAQAVNKLNSNLPSGIYIVRFTSTNGLLTNTKVQIL